MKAGMYKYVDKELHDIWLIVVDVISRWYHSQSLLVILEATCWHANDFKILAKY